MKKKKFFNLYKINSFMRKINRKNLFYQTFCFFKINKIRLISRNKILYFFPYLGEIESLWFILVLYLCFYTKYHKEREILKIKY